MGKRPRSTRKEPVENKGTLNDLNSKEFVKHKRSWIVYDGVGEPEWKDLKVQHPATYPRAIVRYLLECYTQRGMTVLDPMMGSGSTVVEATRFGRRAIGNDLYATNVELAQKILSLHRERGDLDEDQMPFLTTGNAMDAVRGLEDESVHYVLFSPPYSNFLHRSSGGVETRHKTRKKEGLATIYGSDPRDMGNMKERKWERLLVRLTQELHRVVSPGRIMSIVVQNEMRTRLNPIAWKLGLEISHRTPWELLPELIWCQQEKPLTIHGWPSSMPLNNHHHYVLNFIKPGNRPRFINNGGNHD